MTAKLIVEIEVDTDPTLVDPHTAIEDITGECVGDKAGCHAETFEYTVTSAEWAS